MLLRSASGRTRVTRMVPAWRLAALRSRESVSLPAARPEHAGCRDCRIGALAAQTSTARQVSAARRRCAAVGTCWRHRRCDWAAVCDAAFAAGPVVASDGPALARPSSSSCVLTVRPMAAQLYASASADGPSALRRELTPRQDASPRAVSHRSIVSRSCLCVDRSASSRLSLAASRRAALRAFLGLVQRHGPWPATGPQALVSPALTGQIVRDEGPMGLLRGHSATLLRIFPYAAIKYMLYEEAHAVRRALCERC